jgi:hypothetical protein
VADGHCPFTSYFDLLTSLEPSIEAEWSKTQGGRTGRWSGIAIKAGQMIGRIGGQTLDFGVYDYEVTLPGFIVPEHYRGEPWKVHTVDPFPYFPEEVGDALLAKMLRLAEPRSGVIDYDVDGRLVGNWFLEGTGGYGGTNLEHYWEGHIAIVPDALDPSQWRFSFGYFEGSARQFGIKGNSPSPRDVSVESGIVEYELTDYEYFSVEDPSRRGLHNIRSGDIIASINGDQIMGTVLVEMIDDRRLRVEAFPGMAASEIEAFTATAKIFAR